MSQAQRCSDSRHFCRTSTQSPAEALGPGEPTIQGGDGDAQALGAGDPADRP